MTIAELTRNLDEAEHEYLSKECTAFEHLLESELGSLASIRAAEESWSIGLRNGTVRFDFQFDKEITQRYRRWVSNARLCLRQLELQEAKDCFVASAEEFRSQLTKVEEVLLERTQDETAAIAALQDAD